MTHGTQHPRGALEPKPGNRTRAPSCNAARFPAVAVMVPASSDGTSVRPVPELHDCIYGSLSSFLSLGPGALVGPPPRQGPRGGAGS